MTHNVDPAKLPTNTKETANGDLSADPKELSDLVNPATQDEYRHAYFEQLRRRACPGCGEGELPF